LLVRDGDKRIRGIPRASVIVNFVKVSSERHNRRCNDGRCAGRRRRIRCGRCSGATTHASSSA
jgi:hypothetical protein